MENDGVFIINLNTVQTHRDATLCRCSPVGTIGIVHNIGLVQESGRKCMVCHHILKPINVFTVVWNVEWFLIYKDAVDQITGVRCDSEFWGGKALHIHLTQRSDGSTFASRSRDHIIIESKEYLYYVVLTNIRKGERIKLVIIVGGDAIRRQSHLTDVIALIGIEAETHCRIPRSYDLVCIPSVWDNPTMLRCNNLNGVGIMSESHLQHMIVNHRI